MDSTAKTSSRQWFKMPHTFVILFILVFVAAALTYTIPSGKFERVKDKVTGKSLLVTGSYHHVDPSPVSLIEIPKAIVHGLVASADVVFFIFIIGGAFQIISSTGTIEAVTSRVAKKFANKGRWVIPIFITLFSVGGFTMGMSTEVMVFVPIGIAVARALGFDALTGTAMISLGASCGFTAGILNPFNVGLAQAIAQVPMFSGAWLRVILLICLITVTSLYLIRYAGKVRKDPAKGHVYELEQSVSGEKVDFSKLPIMQLKHYLTIAAVIIGFGLEIWGVSKNGWWMEELGALFLTMGIVSGFCAGYGPSRIASEFVKGTSSITYGAFIIGIARGIMVVLEQGNVIDSIVNGLSILVGDLPSSVQVLGMYAFQNIMNVFITSGTGMAVTTMPIMTPLSDLLGVTRQTSVLAFQLGDGITNMILPTSSALMGSLAVSGITYQKWVKFFWPLMCMWLIIGAIFIIVANVIKYA
ncbi:YfcC family protein [Paenibacillus aceris]|uniref:Ion transporter superfamily protein YfcC n=1 Tax=Paenibacillus aceris TaxID=869555 RepID=A0ABS4HV23_9BACL|nr:AbgT family transporter [Paenibacillus aceris]MBP1961854.1 putative ion transporter superfamily protein YfcC [Paenibacillus aceris]NHW34291.1 YfcC family protein [Paenibacillus aceris]